MMATFDHGADPDPGDLRKYFRALRRAQRDIDLRPELYTHYYKKEFPRAPSLEQMDTRRWGPGRAYRLRALPPRKCSKKSFKWIARAPQSSPKATWGRGKYEDSVISPRGVDPHPYPSSSPQAGEGGRA